MSLLLNPGAWLPVLLFSAVGSAGNLAEYYLGRGGADVLTSGTSKITPERWQQIEGLYQKFGAPLLLLSAVPGLGLPLTTAAGAVGVGRTEFLVWVFIGKIVRNWLLVLFVYVGIDLLGFLNAL
jgi:membrane protein YqaA with SNARE-associated domain